MPAELFSEVYKALMTSDPVDKAGLATSCYQRFTANELALETGSKILKVPVPGRPSRPELVSPRSVPKRGMNSQEGRVILAHAIAHIEFNAINLALDAVYRFRDMPAEYYRDWLRVAKEEGEHFNLVREYLENHGHYYGEYPAHNGLWEMAVKTDHDALERMALVPRVLEARGLDVTPGMIKKLEQAGDDELVACLHVIHHEEIGHVAIGTRWYRYLCNLRGIDPRQTFVNLLQKHMKGSIRGPFDELTRKQAGFSDEEMQDLKLLEAR